MYRWEGKVAVVTGASAGIGLATLKAFAEKGMIVVGLARRKELIEKEMAKVPAAKNRFYALKCDVANDKEVDEVFEFINKNIGKVQVLINNAGILQAGKFTEIDNAVLKNIVDVNLMGTVYCTKAVLKVLQAENLEGHIVNINSTVGHRTLRPGGTDLNIYVASKHAITGFCETLVRELMGQSIRVTSVSPGLVATEISSDLPMGADPTLKPEDIADAIVYAVGTPQRVQIKELLIPPLGEKFL